MLGCVHPLKALDEAASFRRWEGFVERRLGVDVQIAPIRSASAKRTSEISFKT